MTAKASIAVLQGRPGGAFRRLLMTRTTLWRKCDAFVQVSQHERETETDRQADRHTHRERERERHVQRQIQRQALSWRCPL